MPASKPRSSRDELGRPVRVQWMRDEETAWDTKGPAYVFKLRGGLDAQGKVVALEYDACAVDHNHLGYNEPDTVLIAQLMGRRPERPAAGGAETPSVMYAIPNRRTTTRVVALPMIWETPLRTGNLRDPNGPQVTFAFESFIDELAAAAEGRSRAVPARYARGRQRGQRVPESALARRRARGREGLWLGRAAVAETARAAARGTIAHGRGIAYTYRSNTIAAIIAEVEVNRETGRRLGQALGVRARLRAGDQSRGPASHRRVRHAARA